MYILTTFVVIIVGCSYSCCKLFCSYCSCCKLFPYKKEWECLFKCQTESGTYSKSPFLLRSAALLNDIIYLLNVNADNTVGQPSRANVDPITDPSGIG
ncbi:hypothetical protein BCR32DRAFT_296048 [Anaeromyces robustus]|uniref:Uncharacterized protein n=1 Tax=Anaeromyces robustus TaxID=1754192 RepID=A0A1Y1WT94_9FUNG|nr:hypothetical protein BCR32DRAFT_296048 [Anaeromyces robustus]|eukprot:ORX76757.1 hypothetical protein BCR32DRAFT_296048 [Anaeromyces robustus]